MKNNKVCVLIDAYGAAKPFVQAFKDRGFDCVHVRTSKTLEPLYKGRFDASEYMENIEFDGDPEALVRKLRTYPLQCVIAGMEPGVELADYLSEQLGLLTNGTQKSAARRNKFSMARVLAENGLRVIPFYKANNVADLLAWRHAHYNWPVVLKPLDSAGIDGLSVCHSDEDIKAAFDKVIQKVNLMGQVNQEMLLQPFINADEYVVNHVSYQGRHFVTDIWRNNKKYILGVGIIYDREELLPFQGKIQESLITYVGKVLSALEINNGPSHAEVKYTSEGPILVEVAARISGAVQTRIYNECLGHNQIDLTVDVYTNPRRFLDNIQKERKIKKFSTLVFASSRKEGVVKDVPLVKTLEKLPSLKGVNLKVKVGDYLRKTIDLNSSSAFIYLAHESKVVIERDYQRIQAALDGGFVVEGE